MGRILSATLTKEDKVFLKVSMSYEESLNLKGHTKNIRVFSDHNAEIQTNISKRGSREATKYFLIPKKLRQDLNYEGEVKCQRIDSKKSTLFIFKVEKEKVKEFNEKERNSK
jgi:hypothetical protein